MSNFTFLKPSAQDIHQDAIRAEHDVLSDAHIVLFHDQHNLATH